MRSPPSRRPSAPVARTRPLAGARRADGAGGFAVDRTGEADHVAVRRPRPGRTCRSSLEVWLIHADGTRQLADDAHAGSRGHRQRSRPRAVRRPGRRSPPASCRRRGGCRTARAVEVGLGVDLDIGLAPPALDALVVLGIGETDAADLVDAHNATGRHGRARARARRPTRWPANRRRTSASARSRSFRSSTSIPRRSSRRAIVLDGLTGRVAPTALPMLGGDLDYFGPGSLAVQGLWPVLWGRYLRDVTGAGDTEIDARALGDPQPRGRRAASRVSGRRAAVRPAADLGVRVVGRRAGRRARGHRSTDPAAGRSTGAPARPPRLEPREARVRRRGHTRPAGRPRICTPRAGTGRCGRSPTSTICRLCAPSPACRRCDTAWDDDTARALRDVAVAARADRPRARTGGRSPDRRSTRSRTPTCCESLCTMEPGGAASDADSVKLGLVGHLFREALIAARAVVGDAVSRLRAGTPIALGPEPALGRRSRRIATRSFEGHEHGRHAICARARIRTAASLAERFREVQEALAGHRRPVAIDVAARCSARCSPPSTPPPSASIRG